jgi:ppGpp synthetase/RelA/SpoT-type nucleotidyltranferase
MDQLNQSIEPRPNEEDFPDWMESRFPGCIKPEHENWYQLNLNLAEQALQNSLFYANLEELLEKASLEFGNSSKGKLFDSIKRPVFVKKSFASCLNKSYRHNVVYNDRFPNPPENGWWTPENWFESINDLLRTQIKCRFADGVPILAREICSSAALHGLKHDTSVESRDAGYYAHHVTIKVPALISDITWQTKEVPLQVEIQVLTQLQALVYDITHVFYSETRASISEQSSNWKWDLGSNRFRASYMGHTLHLIDSLIVELRKNVIDSKE